MFDHADPNAPRPLMQDPAFVAALRLCGQHPLRLPGGLILLQRRIFGLRMLMLPRAAPPPDLARQLAALGLQRRPLILSPEGTGWLPPSLPLARPKARAVLSLHGTATARRARLHPKWRNQLAAARSRGLVHTVAPLPADPDHPVLRLEERQASARGYANWPAPLTAAFAATAPAQTHLFRARLGDRIVAHMLFLSHGSGATYHIGHITDCGKAVCAHNLLLWEASRHFADRGMQSLDLGLLHPATPDLNRFKLRTGAEEVPTGGTHLYWHPFAAP